MSYSYREIAELAFAALGKSTRLRRVPLWLVRVVLPVVRLLSKRFYSIALGITTISQHDFEAPKSGTHTLKEYFEKIAPEL